MIRSTYPVHGGIMRKETCQLEDRVSETDAVSCYASHVIQSETASSLHRQATNEYRNNKPSGNPNIPWRRLDRTYSNNRNISEITDGSMNFKYEANLFPLCCGLLVDFIRVASAKSNSVLTGYPYPLATVIDWLRYTNSRSKWYNNPIIPENLEYHHLCQRAQFYFQSIFYSVKKETRENFFFISVPTSKFSWYNWIYFFSQGDSFEKAWLLGEAKKQWDCVKCCILSWCLYRLSTLLVWMATF